MAIQANVVEDIPPPIEDPYRDQLVQLPHLKDIRLAHPLTDKKIFSVEMLIDPDYFESIVGDKIIHGPGSTAICSI